MNKKAWKWISATVYIGLSVVVFYISFVVHHNSILLSLFGLVFVLLVCFLTAMIEFQIESKGYGLWLETIVSLLLIDVMFLAIYFIINTFVFSVDVGSCLVFIIVFNLIKLLGTSIKSKVDNLGKL